MSNSNHLIHYGMFYLFYILIKSIWESENAESVPLQNNLINKTFDFDHLNVKPHVKKNNYLYYIDTILVENRHDIFYLNLLGIDWTSIAITEEIINEAYYATISKITVTTVEVNNEIINPIKPKLLQAAFDYLIDRSNYLGFEN